MRILLCNDDGIDAAGIRALLAALAPHHTVAVCAPERQQSAVSKALTLYTPLRAERRVLSGYPDVPAYAISGTPVDCVRLGLGNFLDARPDLCISGINLGPNLGTDTLYSGTCAAAGEAAVRGIPAIAVSSISFAPKHLDAAAQVALQMVDFVSRHPLPMGVYYNVNVPDAPFAALRGLRKTGLGVIAYRERYEERIDTIAHPYFWAPREKLLPTTERDTDERWTAEGWVTVTPLTYDNACMDVLCNMTETEQL